MNDPSCLLQRMDSLSNNNLSDFDFLNTFFSIKFFDSFLSIFLVPPDCKVFQDEREVDRDTTHDSNFFNTNMASDQQQDQSISNGHESEALQTLHTYLSIFFVFMN